MKKFVFIVLLFVGYHSVFSQCIKPGIIKTSKVRALKNGIGEKEMAIEAVITISDTSVVLNITENGETETVESEIVEVSGCAWKEYLRDGSMQLQAMSRKGDERAIKSVIDITAKNGFTTISFSDAAKPGTGLQFDVAAYQFMPEAAGDGKKKNGKKEKKKRKD